MEKILLEFMSEMREFRTEINGRFTKLEGEMDERFTKVDKRLSKIENDVTEIKEAVVNNLSESRSHFKHIEQSLQQHHSMFQFMTDEINKKYRY
ncbi:hypothetical protein [Bacillus sp. SM2101]|uniref:hypothetical protein n=1 Tax=Bacillus sp. SM2101 TaxID=2805366 RepID=UPI001BDF177C|nr:hypothetical protein [Bacillus sp. SM2101]